MNFAFNPPLQLFGQTIYSYSGLIEYAKYYSSRLKYVEDRIDQEVNSRLKSSLNTIINTDKYARKSADHWKKKYLKLKCRLFTKYNVFESVNGIKVLIPIDMQGSPKEEVIKLKVILNKLVTALENKSWNQQKIEPEYTENGYTNVKNPYKALRK